MDGRVQGTWTYDAAGHVLEARSPTGQLLSTRTYDGFGGLATTRRPVAR